MNALNRDFNEGDNVRLRSGETVIIIGGFGMYAETTGTALYVKCSNGTTFRASGMDIASVVE